MCVTMGVCDLCSVTEPSLKRKKRARSLIGRSCDGLDGKRPAVDQDESDELTGVGNRLAGFGY